MKTSNYHKSVLLREVTDLLQIKKGKRYIDATLGGGGHTKEILGLGAEVLGIDLDSNSIEYVKNLVKSPNLTLAQGNFREIDRIANLHGFGKVAGVLYDLGVSSHQIEAPSRGFSFQSAGPLDMRMDQDSQVKAADLANLLTERQLYEIFNKFGEEHNSRPLAAAIVRARKVKAISTTGDLLKIIESVYKIKGPISDKFRAAIAKRVFQALRIALNNELENLSESLPKALEIMEDKGRIVVISFHSLEDRIVKQSFLKFEKEGKGKIITKKPILPSPKELEKNPRSRSSKLRVFEKYENI